MHWIHQYSRRCGCSKQKNESRVAAGGDTDRARAKHTDDQDARSQTPLTTTNDKPQKAVTWLGCSSVYVVADDIWRAYFSFLCVCLSVCSLGYLTNKNTSPFFPLSLTHTRSLTRPFFPFGYLEKKIR